MVRLLLTYDNGSPVETFKKELLNAFVITVLSDTILSFMRN